MSNRRTIRRRIPSKPYGRLAGIITACIAILSGVVNGVAPFTIVCRSAIAAVAVGAVVAMSIGVIKAANIPQEKKANL